MQAGAFSKALDMLAEAENQGSGPLDEFASARVEVLRGQIALRLGLGQSTLRWRCSRRPSGSNRSTSAWLVRPT